MSTIKSKQLINYTIDKMTKREKEIFNLVVKGYMSKECAKFLDISVRTVEIHRSNILKKYRAKNFVELVYKLRQAARLTKNKSNAKQR